MRETEAEIKIGSFKRRQKRKYIKIGLNCIHIFLPHVRQTSLLSLNPFYKYIKKKLLVWQIFSVLLTQISVLQLTRHTHFLFSFSFWREKFVDTNKRIASLFVQNISFFLLLFLSPTFLFILLLLFWRVINCYRPTLFVPKIA
jgi:hypothetical protein